MIKMFIRKLKLRITRWTYRKSNLEIKFKIGDIVVPVNIDSLQTQYSFQDYIINTEKGEIVDIFWGSKMHQHQDWYYSVIFTDDSIVQPYNKTRINFNHWEIKLDKVYLREQKLRELGL